MFTDILLATDGSNSSEHAREHALELATRYDAAVHALFVVDRSDLPPDFADRPGGEDVESDIEAVGQQALDEVTARAAERDVPVDTSIRTGVPGEEILEHAEETDADLIVLGQHRRGPLGRFLRRSVTEQVARAATDPVLTVPESDRAATTTYHDILLATDGRKGARRATDCAFELAATYDATIHALSVLDTRISRGPLRDVLEEEAEQTARRLTARAAKADVDFVAERREGRPTEEIIGYASDRAVDLVVLGAHGRPGLDRLFMGSVTRDVLRNTEVPVLTARTRD